MLIRLLFFSFYSYLRHLSGVSADTLSHQCHFGMCRTDIPLIYTVASPGIGTQATNKTNEIPYVLLLFIIQQHSFFAFFSFIRLFVIIINYRFLDHKIENCL